MNAGTSWSKAELMKARTRERRGNPWKGLSERKSKNGVTAYLWEQKRKWEESEIT